MEHRTEKVINRLVQHLPEWCRDLVFDSPKSYALNGLDLKLAGHLKRRFGFFVEAGANDGIQQSNSLYFEKHRMWRGILIEADPDLADKCRISRPRSTTLHAALVPPEQSGTDIELVTQGLMGFVNGAFKTREEEAEHLANGRLTGQPDSRKISVRGSTLSEILDQNKCPRVDLLSLDVEGFEAPALRGLDFSRHAPEHILVEVRYPREVLEVVGRHYSLIAHLTERDWLFRRKS